MIVPSPGVVVLGMHRSGTSVATLLLSRLGLSTPRGEDAMPPDENNRKGYFESRALAEVADDALRLLGATWDTPPAPGELLRRLDELEPLRERARQTAEAVLHPPPWAWKDPRTCVLLPFWQQVIDVAPPLLLMHRDALEVAGSLRRRNGFSLPYGLALWERYVRSSLEHARGRQVHVTSYTSLLADPQGWLASVRVFLEGAAGWRNLPDTPDLSDDLLDPSPAMPECQRVLMTAEQVALADLLGTVQGTHSAFAPGPLPPESPSTEPLLSLQRGWLAERVRRTTTDLNLERAQARAESEAAAWSEQLMSARAESQVRKEALAELERERAGTLVELQECRGRCAQLLAQTEAQAFALQQQNGELEQLRVQHERLLEAQERADELLAQVYRSRTWRYSHAMRSPYAKLRARLGESIGPRTQN